MACRPVLFQASLAGGGRREREWEIRTRRHKGAGGNSGRSLWNDRNFKGNKPGVRAALISLMNAASLRLGFKSWLNATNVTLTRNNKK